MLTGSGFGDDFRFTHPLRQQRLPQHLVSFMRAAVQQIFALQIQRGVRPGCNVLAFGQRGWTPGIVFQQVVELSLKFRIFLRTDKSFFQLAQSRHQDLWHVHAAKLTKIGVK